MDGLRTTRAPERGLRARRRPAKAAVVRVLWSIAAALAIGAPARADVPPAPPAPPPGPPCRGAPPADQWVRECFSAFVAVWRDRLPGPAGEGRLARQVAAFLGAHADFGEFARRALGSSWDAADDERRGRWESLLRNGLERRYLDQLRSPLGATLSVEATRGDCEAMTVTLGVRHRLHRDLHTFEVVLRWDARSWRVTDTVVDEASLLEHYRARFRRIHAAGGVEAVDTYLVAFGAPPSE
jgi:ABC-type transporter MlaC component